MRQTHHVSNGLDIYNAIQASKELDDLEIQGFIRGDEKGKTMDVPLQALFVSLAKQYNDWVDAYDTRIISKMKRSIADIRNVAGCVFLKLMEVSK